MAVTNTRTTKLQQQFDPAAHITVVTCDKDDKANKAFSSKRKRVKLSL